MISLTEYRNDPERVKALRQALENPALREAMAIVQKQPSWAPSDVTPHYAHIRLGRLEGRMLAIEELFFMATHSTKGETLKRDYAGEPAQE